jgi:hypothetical protein
MAIMDSAFYGLTSITPGVPMFTSITTPPQNFFYRKKGYGHFQEIGLESGTALSGDGAEQASMGLAIGDYLHTGRPSLYVTNFSEENDVLYRNDGNWNFTEVSYPAGVALPSPLR